MKYSDQSTKLRVELDTKHCELSGDEIQRLERALDPLRKPVEKFPVATLYITIEFFNRSNDYRVKTVLQLPGGWLPTGDLDQEYYPAFERCIRKLVHKVVAYEGQLESAEDRAKHLKGTRHDLLPSSDVDIAALNAAVEQSDYEWFREQMTPYEDPVRKRVGRWIQRYPVLDAQLDDQRGDRFDITDVVEEVFLNAFERFPHRPEAVPLGTWLEHLIDPSLRILARDTVDELDSISFHRSLRSAE